MTTSSLHKPVRPVCHLCPMIDVEFVRKTDEAWIWRCPGGQGHREPREIAVARNTKTTSHEGVMAEAGLFDDLPRCLRAAEPWVEHGVVEYRYKERYPERYRELVALYGHRTLPGRWDSSVSNLIARALEILESRDHLLAQRKKKGPATGCYRDNGTCGYWALAPGPSEDALVTWNEFAKSERLDPEVWEIPRRPEPADGPDAQGHPLAA